MSTTRIARALGVDVRPAEAEVCALASLTLVCITMATHVLQPLRDGAALAAPSLSPPMLVCAPLLLTGAANACMSHASARSVSPSPNSQPLTTSQLLPAFLRFSALGLLLLFCTMWAALPTHCDGGSGGGGNEGAMGGDGVEGGGAWKALRAVFFLWCSIFSVLAASLGWGAAGAGLRARRARRLFGPVGAGCTIGQLMGSGLVVTGWWLLGWRAHAEVKTNAGAGAGDGGGCGTVLEQLQLQLLLLPVAAAVLMLASRFASRLIACTAATMLAQDGGADDGMSNISSSSSTTSIDGISRNAFILLRASPYMQRVGVYTCCYAFSSAVLFFYKLELVAAATADAANMAGDDGWTVPSGAGGPMPRGAAAGEAAPSPPSLPSARMASFSARTNFAAALCTLLAQVLSTHATKHLRAAATLALLPVASFAGLLALQLALPHRGVELHESQAPVELETARAGRSGRFDVALAVLAAAQVTLSAVNYALVKPARESLWAADMVSAEQRQYCKPLLDSGANRLGFALAAAWHGAAGRLLACAVQGGALGIAQLLVPTVWFCVALQLGEDCERRECSSERWDREAKGHPEKTK